MVSKATNIVEPRYKDDPSLEDDMCSFRKQIDLCFLNLIDYRAHLAHKHSEAAFDSEYYNSFDSIEVVVISDYKMKILASKHREAQEGMLKCVPHQNISLHRTNYC